jgi:hypothetical protein
MESTHGSTSVISIIRSIQVHITDYVANKQESGGAKSLMAGSVKNGPDNLQDDYLYINKKHQGRDDGNNWTTAVICEFWTN